MYVKVKGPDGKRIEIVTIALSMQIKELKEKLANLFHVEPEYQRLIHRGKQLEDKYKLHDYGVQSSDVLQLSVKQSVVQKEVTQEIQVPPSIEKLLQNLPQISESKHFKVGEYVDFLDTHFGAWFQGKVKIIYVEDQARLDAIGKEVNTPTQRNEERSDDCGSIFASDYTKDTPALTTLHRDSPVEISDDEIVDVVTVRSSSPESVIYIPPEEMENYIPPEEQIIYVPPDDEQMVYVPPVIYVEPYSGGTISVDTFGNTLSSIENRQGVWQANNHDRSSDKINEVDDAGGTISVETFGNTLSSIENRQGVWQVNNHDRSSDKINEVDDACGLRIVSTVGSVTMSNENEEEVWQKNTCDQSSNKVNGVSESDHSESGDSGHSSHMSLKNAEQSNEHSGRKEPTDEELPDDGCLYEIINLNNIDQIEMLCKLSQIRPMSRKRLTLTEIQPGQVVLVNYSAEGPDKVGHWFDFKVSKVLNGLKRRWLDGEVRVLSWNPYQLTHVKITKVDEIWKIEKLSLLKDREEFSNPQYVQKRPVRALCENCNDNPAAHCTACSCRVCGMKTAPSKQVMCDECDSPYHVWCLKPPLQEVPEVDQWFCDNCKMGTSVIDEVEEKPKVSKKREHKPTLTTNKWVTSMANASRAKKCTIVPPNHFGPIPGVEVGTSWRFRIQASEAGVHRPPVGGMHGREDVGAFSIVLSGGYEDDEDFGECFWYTGAGGRDLSGNRRVANRQSKDQMFTYTNKALALNCNAPLSEEGAKAIDWREGKPVRVLRSYKFRKRSEYAPEEGLRYDGIYKVVEYRPERGRSGFIVWKYFLRRDDPTPAPWTEEGKRYIQSLGLQVEYPENYDMVMAKKLEEASKKSKETSKKSKETSRTSKEITRESKENSRKPKDSTRKSKDSTRKLEESSRKSEESFINLEETSRNSEESYRMFEECSRKLMEYFVMDEIEENRWCKRIKPDPFQMDPSIEEIIARDEQNLRLWEHCSFYLGDGKTRYLEAVKENFTCICCQELVYQPVTTPCNHNVCLDCLQRSFKAGIYSCPSCAEDLPEMFPFVVNEHLFEALKALFPGYGPQK